MVQTARIAATTLALILLSSSAVLAAPITYFASLDGPSEAPPNNSPGTGFASVEIDTVAHTMRIQANFTGLLGTTTAAHVHAATATPFTGTAGVATQTPSFAGFPLGVTSGSMDQTFNTLDAGTWNSAYITANGGTTAAMGSIIQVRIPHNRPKGRLRRTAPSET